MQRIHVMKKIDSEYLHLPELKPFVGKMVEIVVAEVAPATREEFYAEAGHLPATPEEWLQQQVTFLAWRADPRFERFWPLIDRFLAEARGADAGSPRPEKAAS